MSELGERGVARLRRALDAPDLESDRYRALEVLGQGGMGTVYLAEDQLLGRPVAVKVLLLEDLSAEGVERMAREAHTLARLEHPGIVPVHDVGHLPDGRVFYAMKRVRGERLDRHVTAATPLAERLRLFLKVCETVAFAHAAGVLHRDLKPENVMVGEYGEVLVLDWGVAQWTRGAGPAPAAAAAAPLEGGEPATRGTRSGTVVGTPAYMAPEQARGEPVDVRADVYGLGATLGFLVADAGAPPSLRAIVRRATHADPDGRYTTAGELAADVGRFLDGARVLAHPEGLLGPVIRFVRRHRVPIALLAAYLVLRVVLWIYLRPSAS